MEALDLPLVLSALALVAALIAAGVAARPGAWHGVMGGVVGFVAFLGLPFLVTALGAKNHLEHAKSNDFCLSCHEMEPYGRSLALEDTDYLPASHFQNRRVDRDYACFTCHTSYTMYGDFEAKIRGVRHLWVHYFGTLPDPIALYEPYANRECLYCHSGARDFEENELHADEREALTSDETSCLECHDLAHGVDELDGAEMWEGADL